MSGKTKLPYGRLTFDGNFCDIAKCREERWGKYCPDGACSQRKVWERLKEYEDTTMSPTDVLEYKKFEDELIAFGMTLNALLERGSAPMTLKEANAFVEQNHRHHKPVVGHKFSIGCTDGEKIVGVAIVGRPVSRVLDDGWTLEVNRLCTDGTHNACSMLYAAAWRAARAMGYHKLVTYILDTESGVSLKAAGWKCVGQAGGLRWTGKRRPEVDLYPAQMKLRFEIGDGDNA